VRILTYLVAIFIVFLGITFALLNAEPVNIHYYIGQRILPLSLLLALSLGFGLIIGLSSALFMLVRMKTQNYQLKKKIKENQC